MRDGRLRRTLKALALLRFRMELGLHRFRLERQGQPHFRLAGSCVRNGACCREPGIQVGPAVWHVPLLRRLFLWWQRSVNGFEPTRTLARSHVFLFRCTHYDEASNSCDSYDSRPGMCRDYPRIQIQQAVPEFLPGCGYRAVARNAAGLRRALAQTSLAPEDRARVERSLRIEE